MNLFQNPKTRWIAIFAVAVYIISPLDLIPDFVPIAGLFDDGLLLTALIVILNKAKEFRKIKEVEGR